MIDEKLLKKKEPKIYNDNNNSKESMNSDGQVLIIKNLYSVKKKLYDLFRDKNPYLK